MKIGGDRNGFTLVELVIVVTIIAVIAMLAVSRLSTTAEKAKRTAAENDLKVLATAFTDPDHGYLRDMRGIPGFSSAHLRIANLLISTNLYGTANSVDANGTRVDNVRQPGCAQPEVFTRWNPESERGWHGPYVRHATGAFPTASDTRFPSDASFASRKFYPNLYGLRLPADFLNGLNGCSIYGFPGEPARTRTFQTRCASATRASSRPDPTAGWIPHASSRTRQTGGPPAGTSEPAACRVRPASSTATTAARAATIWSFSSRATTSTRGRKTDETF